MSKLLNNIPLKKRYKGTPLSSTSKTLKITPNSKVKWRNSNRRSNLIFRFKIRSKICIRSCSLNLGIRWIISSIMKESRMLNSVRILGYKITMSNSIQVMFFTSLLVDRKEIHLRKPARMWWKGFLIRSFQSTRLVRRRCSNNRRGLGHQSNLTRMWMFNKKSRKMKKSKLISNILTSVTSSSLIQYLRIWGFRVRPPWISRFKSF